MLDIFALLGIPALWAVVLGLIVAAVVGQFLPPSVSAGEVGAWIVTVFFICGLIYDFLRGRDKDNQ
ncbi:hypothetical protein BH11PSE11_BH11PSE11_21000 [soil metagenome]